VILKSLAGRLATGAAAAAVVGAVTAGLTSASWDVTSRSPQVQPVVFGVPMPLDEPGVDVPTDGDLYSVLNGLADPNVSFSFRATWSKMASASSKAKPPTR
jgi:hypothetical protein